MDKWTEGELVSPKLGKGLRKRTLLIAFSIVGALLILFCITVVTNIDASCDSIDLSDPQVSDVNLSFLKTPGKLIYPCASIRSNEEGKVGVKFFIDSSGEIISKEIIFSSGHDRLDQAALNSVSTFVIDKEKIDSVSQSEKKIRISFELED